MSRNLWRGLETPKTRKSGDFLVTGEAMSNEVGASIFFIHVRKTGGGSIKIALRPFLESHRIALWPHSKSLRQVPEGGKAILGIREPVSRFVSGFNSRLRKGLPKNHNPWSDDERAAFERFQTPNDLAEGLASKDRDTVAEAQRSMKSIAHVRHRYVATFGSSEYLSGRAKDVLMVIHQPEMAHDFEVLKRLIGLPASAHLTDDPVQAHRTPAGFSSDLSEQGRRAIEQWYAEDIGIYATAMALRQNIMAGAPDV